jgi:hypothetical protein
MALKPDAPANSLSVDDFSSNELSAAIENLRAGGFKDKDIALKILTGLELSAISILKAASKIYPYAPDRTLTNNQNFKEKIGYERKAWLNEAYHMQEHPNVQIATVANAIIEVENARNHAVKGDTENAFLSIFQAAIYLTTGKEHGLTDDVVTGRQKIKAMQPVAKTGERVLNGFVKAGVARGKQQTNDRKSHWQSWQNEAEIIAKNHPNIKSIYAIASLVRRSLNLQDSVNTIRLRITKSW